MIVYVFDSELQNRTRTNKHIGNFSFTYLQQPCHVEVMLQFSFRCASYVAVHVDYIHVLELTWDNMWVVAGIPEMVADFKEVSRCSTPVLYYDTTFCLGNFYVSALLYRNDAFDGAPVMPLLLLVHERRMTESHELLLKWLLKLTGLSTAVFVVDREAAITRAIGTVVPHSKVVYCWNHILGDVRVSICMNNHRH